MVSMDIVNIYENYNNYFEADFKSIFEICSKSALKNGYKLYLIVGIVRDLLLARENFDIDITVEGDAIEFCKILENEGVAKILSIHPDFGTAKIEIQGKKIDFASTRSETYPRKGHLPIVEKIGCSLELDVIRRDFTINSLALSLNQDTFADLMDYVGGLHDLKSKKIRILHEKSFVDDPTRIIRGLKFSIRLGFELEENTLKLQEEYLNNINYDMSYKRVKNELKETFELNSQDAFEKFVDEKIYKLITQRDIQKSTQNIENLIKTYKPKHSWIVYLGTIGVLEEDDFSDKLGLTKVEKKIIIGAKTLLNSEISEDDFEIYKTFTACDTESLLILVLFKNDIELYSKQGISDAVGLENLTYFTNHGNALNVSPSDKKVFRYLDILRKIKISITGQDLLELGIEPSKSFGEIFDYVLKQKLQNPRIGKAEEIALIKAFYCN